MMGQMPASSFESTTQPTNVFLGSVSTSAVFDDNLLSSRSNRIAGEQYYVAAAFAFQQTRRRMKWNLSYRPGVNVANHTTLRNQFNQSFGATVEFDPTQRFSLLLRQDYMVTTDPFERFGTAALQPGIGPLEQPNDTVALPQLKWTTIFSGATAAYRLSRHTTVGLNGSYAVQRYSDYENMASAIGLMNSNTATGDAFVSHDFSRRYTSGLEYRLMDLQFSRADMRTRTHSVLWFHQFTFTPHHSLVVYAGPEYSRSRAQLNLNIVNFQLLIPVSSNLWSPSVGGVYTYRGGHSSFQVSYMRRISDGGGYIGAVQMQSGSLSLNRELARRWTAGLTSEAMQETTVFNENGSRLRLLQAGFGLTHQITTNMSVRLAYDRLYQHGKLLGYAQGNHNRVMLSIQRSFSKPLGR
jgi:hypothetical protein